MTLLSLIGHQAKVTNCIRSRFCKYKPGCGVSHNSNHRAAELVTRAIPQLSQETEHFCRSVNKSYEDCPVWGAIIPKKLEESVDRLDPPLYGLTLTLMRQTTEILQDIAQFQPVDGVCCL